MVLEFFLSHEYDMLSLLLGMEKPPHALSLLHPNWPENLFGKVYFLQPEFLILPILAFSAFL